MELRNKKRISNWVLGGCLIGIGILSGHVIVAVCFIACGIYLCVREEK